MKGSVAPFVAGAAALALVAAAATVSNRRQRALELSPIPSVENPGPRGLAAARAWLESTEHAHRVLSPGDEGPRAAEVLLLIAPQATVREPEAAALLAHAERGGLVVWALGEGPQPNLEMPLRVQRARGASDFAEHAAVALTPHPLFEGIVLRTGGASLRTTNAAALPAAGETGSVSALAVALGAGEVIVLAGPDALENFRLGDGGNLGLLSRLAHAGPLAFDERHLSIPAAAARPSSRGTLLFAGQAILAIAALLLALGRRLGAIRVAVEPQRGHTARDYLASLGALYRTTGSEEGLRAEAWRSLRRSLERRAGIPVRVADAEVAGRLSLRSPVAAAAFERGLAELSRPPSEASLMAVVRADAQLDATLSGSRRTAR